MSRRSLVTFLALSFLAAPTGAAKPKPPPCEPGSFVVTESQDTLLPEADPSGIETIEVAADGMVSVSSGCPEVLGKLKTNRKGTKVSAKWAKATCTGLPKKVKLKARFDESCQVLAGKLKSKRHKRPFTAQRIFESEGFGAPSLDPVLEEGASLTRSVGPEGGEILTWGADGTTYRLRVPAGVLDSATAITITPVVSIGNLPLEGGLLQAVAFAPAGLAFSPSATLTITSAEPLIGELVAGFGWSGDDDAFGVAPWWVDEDGGVHVRVDHFSGYGIGIPGPSQLDTLAAELLAQQGAQNAFVMNVSCLVDLDCTAEERAQLLGAWFDQLVDPQLVAGGAGSVEAIRAQEALLAWIAARLGFGLDNDFLESLESLAVLQNLLNLVTVFERYTSPACSGEVTDWRDWIRVPQELSERARAGALYSASQLEPLAFDLLDGACAELTLKDLSFPSTLADDQTELPLSFQSVVTVEGQPDVGVETEVDLSFGPGASGQQELSTETNGDLETEVSRDPTTPRVAVDIVAREPTTGLSRLERVLAGNTDFVFEGNLSASVRYVPTSGTKELCVLSQVASAGTQVGFSIVDPGTLAATSAPLLDLGLPVPAACVEYQAPGGPVARNLPAVVTATMDFDGETYTDTIQVFPHWKDVILQADVGSGLVNATNTTLPIPGDGPYSLSARIEQAGETAADPPLPVVGEAATVTTGEQTLAAGGSPCCATSLSIQTDGAGEVDFQWRANGTVSSEYSIQVSAGNGASLVAASVTLERAVGSLEVAFPGTVEPDVDEALIVTVTDQSGNPVAGARIEIDATGGSVVASFGTAGPNGVFETTARLHQGEPKLTLEVRAYTSPGGALLAVRTVEAFPAFGLPAFTAFRGFQTAPPGPFVAEIELSLDASTGVVALQTCLGGFFDDSLPGGGPSCLDDGCDGLWEGTLVGDQLTASMFNHTSPCAIGDPGQDRLYGCPLTATVLREADGSLSLTGSVGPDGTLFTCGIGFPPQTFRVCDPGCAPE